MTDVAVIRELATELRSKRAKMLDGVGMQQGVVVTVADKKCTVRLAGHLTETPGFSFLADAYSPHAGDIVWVVDAGPSSRFVLGTLTPNRPKEDWVKVIPTLDAPLAGAAAGAILGGDDWPNTTMLFLAGGYNQSGGVAGTHGSLGFYAHLEPGTWKCWTDIITVANGGHYQVRVYELDGTVVGSFGQATNYAASTVAATRLHPSTVAITEPKTYLLTPRKMGTKDAASTGYFVLMQRMVLSRISA